MLRIGATIDSKRRNVNHSSRKVPFFIARFEESYSYIPDLFKKLSIVDRLLTPLILVTMVVGVVIGKFAPNVQRAFDTVRFDSVSVRE
jgi:hypothetical protein